VAIIHVLYFFAVSALETASMQTAPAAQPTFDPKKRIDVSRS
jgi:hypothetical protein